MNEMTLAEITRAVSYALSAVSSTWVALLFLNDHRRPLAYFFFGNAAMNIGWLISLALVVSGFPDRQWREVMTPLVAFNAVLLMAAMVARLRQRKNGKVYFTHTETETMKANEHE
jgi:polyferredoxin